MDQREQLGCQYIQDAECVDEAAVYLREKALRELGYEFAKKYATEEKEYLFYDIKNHAQVKWHSRQMNPEYRFRFIGTIVKFALK